MSGPGGGQRWGQNIPMPNILPRPPGTRNPNALADDDPQPTSALGEVPQTLSIEPPAPGQNDPAAEPVTAAADPGTAVVDRGTAVVESVTSAVDASNSEHRP